MTLSDIIALDTKEVSYRTGEISNGHYAFNQWNKGVLRVFTRSSALPKKWRNSTPFWHKGDPVSFLIEGHCIELNPRDFNESQGLFIMEEYLTEIRPPSQLL